MKLDWLWPPKSAHFFIAALLLGVVAIMNLRANNLKMVELRAAVFAADEAAVPVGEKLDSLRAYIYRHMNTSTEVQLKYSYQRKAQELIKKNNNIASNVDIFDDLPPGCSVSQTFSNITDPCVRNHINKKLKEIGNHNPQPLILPDKRLYIYQFKAPLLSLDPAGLTLAAAIISGLTGCFMVVINFMRNELAFYRGDIDGLE